MQKSKLIFTLQTLSVKELQQFELYVASPFFNQNKRLIALLKILKKYAPTFSHRNLTKEKVYKKLFPKQSYHDQKMRDEMSHLFGLLKDFLAQLEFRDVEQELGNLWLLRQLRKRKAFHVFQLELNSFDRKLSKSPTQDAKYYYTQYLVSNISNQVYGQKQIRDLNQSIQQKLDYFDIYYLYIKLRESCEMLNRKQILNVQYELRMIPELLSFLEQEDNPYMKVAGIRIYYQILYMLMEGDKEEHYHRLVDLLDVHHGDFPTIEARAMYKHAQNYCIRRINRGGIRYMREILRLYKKLLQNRVIFMSNEVQSQEELEHTDYKNIVTVGVRLKEYEWVEGFIRAYKPYVAKQHKENVYNYSLALLYFETKRTKQAVHLLQTIEFSDVYYQLGAKHLLVSIFYQTQEWESLLYLIEAFKIYLRRNKKLSVAQRTGHTNFLKFLKRLVLLRSQQGYMDRNKFLGRVQKLSDSLQGAKDVYKTPWLRTEIQKIGKNSI